MERLDISLESNERGNSQVLNSFDNVVSYDSEFSNHPEAYPDPSASPEYFKYWRESSKHTLEDIYPKLLEPQMSFKAFTESADFLAFKQTSIGGSTSVGDKKSKIQENLNQEKKEEPVLIRIPSSEISTERVVMNRINFKPLSQKSYKNHLIKDNKMTIFSKSLENKLSIEEINRLLGEFNDTLKRMPTEGGPSGGEASVLTFQVEELKSQLSLANHEKELLKKENERINFLLNQNSSEKVILQSNLEELNVLKQTKLHLESLILEAEKLLRERETEVNEAYAKLELQNRSISLLTQELYSRDELVKSLHGELSEVQKEKNTSLQVLEGEKNQILSLRNELESSVEAKNWFKNQLDLVQKECRILQEEMTLVKGEAIKETTMTEKLKAENIKLRVKMTEVEQQLLQEKRTFVKKLEAIEIDLKEREASLFQSNKTYFTEVAPLARDSLSSNEIITQISKNSDENSEVKTLLEEKNKIKSSLDQEINFLKKEIEERDFKLKEQAAQIYQIMQDNSPKQQEQIKVLNKKINNSAIISNVLEMPFVQIEKFELHDNNDNFEIIKKNEIENKVKNLKIDKSTQSQSTHLAGLESQKVYSSLHEETIIFPPENNISSPTLEISELKQKLASFKNKLALYEEQKTKFSLLEDQYDELKHEKQLMEMKFQEQLETTSISLSVEKSEVNRLQEEVLFMKEKIQSLDDKEDSERIRKLIMETNTGKFNGGRLFEARETKLNNVSQSIFSEKSESLTNQGQPTNLQVPRNNFKDQSTNTMETFDEEIKLNEKNYEKVLNQRDKLERDCIDLESKLQTELTERQAINSKLLVMQNKLNISEVENSHLKSELVRVIKASQEEIDRCRQEIIQKQWISERETNSFNQEREKFFQKIKEMEEKVLKKQENVQLESLISTKREEVEKLNVELHKEKEINLLSANQISELQFELISRKKEITELKKELTEMTFKFEVLNKKKEEFEERKGGVLENSLEWELRQEIQRLTLELNKITSERDYFSNQINQLKLMNGTLTEQIKTLQWNLSQRSSDLKSQEEKNSLVISRYECEIISIKENYKSKCCELVTLEKELSLLTRERSELKARIVQFKQAIIDILQQHSKIESSGSISSIIVNKPELEKLLVDVGGPSSDNKSFVTLKSTMNLLTQEIESLQTKVKEHTSDVLNSWKELEVQVHDLQEICESSAANRASQQSLGSKDFLALPKELLSFLSSNSKNN